MIQCLKLTGFQPQACRGETASNVIFSLVQSDYIGHSKLDQKIQSIDVGTADWTSRISLYAEGITDPH